MTSDLLTLLFAAGAVGAAPLAVSGPGASCPNDMRIVQGTHHEQVQRLCLDYRKSKCWSFLPGLVMMEPRRTPVSACMDIYEWPNTEGANPTVMMSYVEAEAACASRGKRMCSEVEWELACEGPEHRPWPYGWKQRKGVCNSDKPYRHYDETKINSHARAVRNAEARRLWQGAASGAFAACESSFGVRDLVGNVEEWVATSRPEWPYRSSLKGGYWSKAHSGCRGTNERHGPQFRFYEIGFRCCKEPS